MIHLVVVRRVMRETPSIAIFMADPVHVVPADIIARLLMTTVIVKLVYSVIQSPVTIVLK